MTQLVHLQLEKNIATVTLNRPEAHNALNPGLIEELTQIFTKLEAESAVRVVILAANGRSFCAGADIGQMTAMGQANAEQNHQDASKLENLLHLLYSLSKPTIAMVHGSVYGGGLGLVGCVDIALAADNAVFSLSEVKLGLVPALISPYVLNAIGERAARRYFLTAERFGAVEALRLGLIHEVVSPAELLPVCQHLVRALLDGGPRAQGMAKKLIRDVAGREITSALREMTVETITRCRAGEEAREGLNAFLEKRLPRWRDKNL